MAVPVSDDLVAWLREQIEGDKAIALATSPSGRRLAWRPDFSPGGDGEAPSYWVVSDPDPAGVALAMGLERDTGARVAVHIAGHDPQDTIARCEAELAILDEHYILWRHDTSEAYEEFSVVSIGGANQDHGCVTCHYYGQGGVKGYGYCRTVRHLGSGYRHRPGYREEEWKP